MAAHLFLERSYQAVGVDEICAAADARKGSFYYYFSSKGELAKAVVDLHAETFAARLVEFSDDDPVHCLRAIPDMIGAIQTEFESQFGRAVGCPLVIWPPSCPPPMTPCGRTLRSFSRSWKRAWRCFAARPLSAGLFGTVSILTSWPLFARSIPGRDPTSQTQ